MVNAEFVAKAKAAGMRVIPYTVDTEKEAVRMKAAGVDAIITKREFGINI